MDPLDKLFRKILSTRDTIPYQERYWKDLEVSMDAQRRVRRAGGIYWRYGILAGLMLLLSVLLIFVPFSSEKSEQEQLPPPTTELDIPVAELDIESELPDPTGSDTGRNDVASLSGTEDMNGNQGAPDSFRPGREEPNALNLLTRHSTTITSSESDGSTHGFEKDKLQHGAGNANNENISNDEQHSAGYSVLRDIRETDPMPQAFGVINWLYHIAIPIAEPFLPETKEQSFKKGIAIAVATFSDFSAGHAGLSRSPGFGLGTQFDFPLSHKLAITAEMGAHLQQGGFAFQKRSEQIALGFRATGTQYELDLHTLYHVYGSAGLTIVFRRHSIYGGLGLNYTLAGKGEILSADLADPASVKSMDSWLSLDGIRRFQPDIRMYYGYQVYNRVGLMIGLRYQAGRLIDVSALSNADYTFSGKRSRIYPLVGLNFDLIKPARR